MFSLVQQMNNYAYFMSTYLSTNIPDHLLVQLGEEAEWISIPEGGKVSVDILIGLDAYWRIRIGKIMFLSQNLAAQKIMLGWVLSGAVPDSDNKSEISCAHSIFCHEVKQPTAENWLWVFGVHRGGGQPRTRDLGIKQGCRLVRHFGNLPIFFFQIAELIHAKSAKSPKTFL